jgi:hydroxymethylpyrimidine pyrophosphatase-like HAD family hydrolase
MSHPESMKLMAPLDLATSPDPIASAGALVALDIDGTIVKTGHRIPEVTVRAVRDVVACGHHLVLATGRSHAGALAVVRELGLRRGRVVLSNGATVARIETTPVTRRTCLVVEEQAVFDPAQVLLRTCGAAPDAILGVEDTTRGGWRVSHRFSRGLLSGRQRRVRWEHELWDRPTTRAVVHAPDATGLLDELRWQAVTATLARADWIDLVGPGVSKATALQRIQAVLGIAGNATVAVGDAANDLEMLRWAQTAVVMGQASDEVKAAADIVTGTIDQHGLVPVLHALAGSR